MPPEEGITSRAAKSLLEALCALRSREAADATDKAKGGLRVRLTRFYTAEAHLARRFERVGRRLGVRGEAPEEVCAWQNELRAVVARCLGMETFERCPRRALLERP